MSVNQVNQTTGALSPIAGGTLYADTAIGSIIPFGGSIIPSSFLLCNGQSLLRTDYPELFAVIGTSFGSVDSTHFNIPDLRDKFPEGASNTNTLGSAKSAGLPNITGNASLGYNDSSAIGVMTRSANGAFVTQKDGSTYWSGPAANIGTYDNSFHFDASRSNSIYGKSTTVQPPAVCVNYIIKATTIALPSDFSDQVDDMIDAKIVNNLASGDMRAATSNTVYNCVTVAPTTEDITSCLNTDVATASGVNVTYFHNKQILINFSNIVPKVAGNGKTLLQNLPFNFASPQAVSILAVDTSQSATDTHCVIYTNPYNNWLGAHMAGVGKHYYGQIISVIR